MTREPAAARLRAIPPWAWVTGFVLASALARYVLARRVPAPWIMVDELVYSELAKGLAESGRFVIRDEPAGGAYGVVYPLLIAPAYVLFDAVPNAYTAVKAINALLMSLAAVPAYLLARRVLPPGRSLLAAALALALPSLAYTSTLMTENAFYPLFLVTALALVLYLERPTHVRAALVLVAVGLAWLTRAQALVLVPAVLSAPLLLGVRRYRNLYTASALAAAGLAAVQLVRGRSLLDLLGAYEPVSDRTYELGATAKWLVYHAAELELSIGVVPVVAAILLASAWRGLPAPAKALLATTLALTAWLLVSVAAFAAEVPVPPHVLERNLFYVAPLFLVGLLAWIEHGLPRPPLAAVAAGLAAVVLPAVLPYATVIGPHAVPDSPALLPLWRLAELGISLSNLWPIVALTAAAGVAATLAIPNRLALVLPIVVLAYFVVSAPAVYEGPHGFRTASRQALAAGIGAADPDWIDRAVDGDVAAVWSGHASPYSIWENEFFNRRVGTVFRASGPLPGALPEQVFRAAAGTEYALSDGTLALSGETVAEDQRKGLTVYRVAGSLQPIVRVTGLYADDTWSGPRVTYERTQCRGGVLTVTVASDPALFAERQSLLVATPGGRPRSLRVPLDRPRDVTVPLQARAGRCTVAFEVSPTARAPGDPRELGLHFTRFLLRTSPG